VRHLETTPLKIAQNASKSTVLKLFLARKCQNKASKSPVFACFLLKKAPKSAQNPPKALKKSLFLA